MSLPNLLLDRLDATINVGQSFSQTFSTYLFYSRAFSINASFSRSLFISLSLFSNAESIG